MIIEPIPKIVRFDATWACNLKCKHCQTGMFRKPGHHLDLTTSRLLDLFTELRDLGTEKFVFIGGEPLVRRDFGQLIDALARNQISPALTTNGLLLTPEKASHFFSKSVDPVLTVSLDGPDEASNDAVRGQGVFSKALQGLQQALKARDSSERGRVGVSFVITRHSVANAEKIIDLAEDLEVDFLTIANVHAVGDAISNWNELAVGDQELWDAAIRIARRLSRLPDLPVNVNFYAPLVASALDRLEGLQVVHSPQIDSSAWSECYVQHDGRVWPLQKVSEMVPDAIGRAADLGMDFSRNSLNTHSMKDLFYGAAFSKYREIQASHQYIKKLQPCAKCAFSSSTCLPSLGYFLAGEYRPRPMCTLAARALEVKH